MVLSNKKLKQTLRAAKAELLVAAASDSHTLLSINSSEHPNDHNPNPTQKSLVHLVTQKAKLSKERKKRRAKAKSLQENHNADKENGEFVGQLEGDVSEEKKRKRDEDEGEGNGDQEVKEENEPLKKKKKKRNRDENEGEGITEAKKVAVRNRNKTKLNREKRRKNRIKKKDGEGGEKGSGELSLGGEKGSEELSLPETIKATDSKDAVMEASTKVYVGGIPYYSTEDDIRSYFESCGTITEIDCMKFPESGKFRGIAILNFKTEAAAKRALALDGSDMGGLFLKIQQYKSSRVKKDSNFCPTVVEGYNRIYVGNLSWDITEDDLKKFFVDCSISSIRFGEDKVTGEFRGYAHVDFADSTSLNMALKLDQKVVCGRPIKISCAVPKKGTLTNSASKPKDGSSTVSKSKPNEVDSSETPIEIPELSGKIRRRTCFECGQRGHLQSDCPNKQSAPNFDPKPKDGSTTISDSEPEANQVETKETPSEVPAADAKIRRRTCYECGQRGHLSSDCPSKQAATKSESKPNDELTSNSKPAPEDQVRVSEIHSEVPVSSGKIRRRTCYECGQRGHLSSDCSSKQAATNSESKPNDELTSNSKPEPEDQVCVSEMPSELPVSSGKIRRRTCYECGQRGHLSSNCPNKAVVQTDPVLG